MKGHCYEIGRKIKKLRSEKGISQEKLADELNVSRSAIAKWETNGGIPEVSNLILQAKILGVSLDALVDDMEQEESIIADRKYFCQKHVRIELASAEEVIKGFLNFRNDDYRDVVILSFEETKIKLQFGREININEITKIEELMD